MSWKISLIRQSTFVLQQPNQALFAAMSVSGVPTVHTEEEVQQMVHGPLRLDPNGTYEDVIAFLVSWSKDEDWTSHFKGINVADLLRFTAEDLAAILGQALGRALYNRLADQKSDQTVSVHYGDPTVDHAPKRLRLEGTDGHQLVTAPTFTGVWRSGQWTATKQKYQKHTCSGKECRQRIRTHCTCDPSRFWCAACFYEQHKAMQ